LPPADSFEDEQPARKSDDSATAETAASARFVLKLITSLLGYVLGKPITSPKEYTQTLTGTERTFSNFLVTIWLLGTERDI
jgi:hypothetical protein